MNAVGAQRHRPAVALAALALVVAAGCGRKGGTVPADFSPAGQYGQDNLLTVEMLRFSVDTVNRVPGVRIRVYDRTPADGYRLYRRVGGQGFDVLSRATALFAGSFDHGYETYEAIDRDWQPNRAADYQARGEIAGVESALSPLTNVATLPAAAADTDLVAADLGILCPIGTLAVPTRTDSTPVLVWQAMPGASRYLLRVTRLDRRIFFYGFTPPDGSSSYKMGSGLGTILQDRPLSLKSFFDWSVEAIDLQSRVIGRSLVHRFETRPIVESDSLVFCSP